MIGRFRLIFNPDTAPGGGSYFRPAFEVAARSLATLSQLRIIDSKRLVKKILQRDCDILAPIKKEASRVNFA